MTGSTATDVGLQQPLDIGIAVVEQVAQRGCSA